MLKSLVKKIIGILPHPIQNEMLYTLDRFNKNKQIKAWTISGKPLPVPSIVKQTMVEEYQKLSGYTILVETGTYLGDMVNAQRKNFQKIYSIELGKDLYLRAVERFKSYRHINMIQGDSAIALDQITKELKDPVIFWLDAHYSGGITALGDKECPIFGEIDAIFKYTNHLPHILLVDDARCFVGQNDYPTIERLSHYIQSKQPKYVCEVKDDVIRFEVKE